MVYIQKATWHFNLKPKVSFIVELQINMIYIWL
jgi:hypothetical protein